MNDEQKEGYSFNPSSSDASPALRPTQANDKRTPYGGLSVFHTVSSRPFIAWILLQLVCTVVYLIHCHCHPHHHSISRPQQHCSSGQLSFDTHSLSLAVCTQEKSLRHSLLASYTVNEFQYSTLLYCVHKTKPWKQRRYIRREKRENGG